MSVLKSLQINQTLQGHLFVFLDVDALIKLEMILEIAHGNLHGEGFAIPFPEEAGGAAPPFTRGISTMSPGYHLIP